MNYSQHNFASLVQKKENPRMICIQQNITYYYTAHTYACIMHVILCGSKSSTFCFDGLRHSKNSVFFLFESSKKKNSLFSFI